MSTVRRSGGGTRFRHTVAAGLAAGLLLAIGHDGAAEKASYAVLTLREGLDFRWSVDPCQAPELNQPESLS
jgi:hypothetical protein